jgi:hypothetical protein
LNVSVTNGGAFSWETISSSANAKNALGSDCLFVKGLRYLSTLLRGYGLKALGINSNQSAKFILDHKDAIPPFQQLNDD